MKNFRRALQDSARYWPRIVLAVLCSSAAAALWGANIAAIFPIVEVSLHGVSPQGWNQRRITASEQRIAKLHEEIEAAENAAERGAGAQPAAGQQSLADLKVALLAERTRLTGAAKLQPWLVKYVPADPFQFLLLVVGWLMVASTLRQATQTFANVCVAQVSQNVARSIRHRVFDKTLDLDRAAFMAQGPSGFAVQIVQVCDMLAAGIQNIFGGAVSEPLRLVACIVGAAMISWRLLLASMLFTPFAVFLIMWLNRRLRSVARTALERSQSFYHVMYEALENIATIQLFSMEEHERTRFRQATHMMRRMALRSALYSNLVSPVTEVLGLSVLCLSITIGAHMLLHQRQSLFGIPLMDRPLGVSELMVFFAMLLGTTDPIRRMASVVTHINSGMIAADALYPLLDRRPLIEDPVQPQTPPRPHSELRLSQVTFAYQPASPVLQDVNLSIPFGQTLAIVGANGTGKSTLVNLLCRFYDPQRGAITLDNVPLKAMTRSDLRGRIAVVTQHTELFNESLLYNIRYSRPEATDEDVIRAATMARAHEFIAGFPEQYQTLAGPNGMRLSGGQRQRIALARALLRDPEILILDEATSQIDVESERLIHDALKSFKGTRTILLITHRQSALKLADRIIRMLPTGIEEASDQRLQSAA